MAEAGLASDQEEEVGPEDTPRVKERGGRLKRTREGAEQQQQQQGQQGPEEGLEDEDMQTGGRQVRW